MTKDELNTWHSNIELGLRYKKEYSTYTNWKTYKNWYRGHFKNDGVPYNKIYTHIRALIPSVYSQNPAVSITALKPEMQEHAKLVEVIDKYLITELNIKTVMKDVILDAAICGTGFIKVGYDSQYGYKQRDAVGLNGDTLNQLGKDGETLVEYNEDIKSGMPWVMRVPPEDIITPYGYSDIKAFPWIAHRIIRPIADVKNDSRYKNTSNLSGGYIADVFDRLPRMGDENSIGDGFIELYEIRDVTRGRVYVISEEEVLLDEVDELQIEGLPYKVLIFNKDPDRFWGIPDISMVEGQQLEINDICERMERNRAYSGLKFIVSNGALDEEELSKLTSTDSYDIGSVIRLSASSDMISNAIQPIQLTDSVKDLTQSLLTVESQMRDTLGFSRNQSGEYSGESSATATEAQIVSKANETRTNERKDLAIDVFIAVLKKFNQMIFMYWNFEKFAEIAGQELAIRGYIPYDSTSIRDEFNIHVDPDSGMPVTQGMKTQQMIQLFQLFAQDPYINPIELRKKVLTTFSLVDATIGSLLMQPQQMIGGEMGSQPAINMPMGDNPQGELPSALEQNMELNR